jgi:hypothetical protein
VGAGLPRGRARRVQQGGDGCGGGESCGQSTGRKGISRGPIGVKVTEYDLSEMSGEEVDEWERQHKVHRPAGADALTIKKVGIDTHVTPTAKGLRIDSSNLSVDQYIVYWESPGSESKAGDGTLRDHEYRHVRANIATVQKVNQAWKPTTIKVPGGDIGAAWGKYDDMRLNALDIRLRQVNDRIDSYLLR